MVTDTPALRDALTGQPLAGQPLLRLPGLDDDRPFPLRLHTREPEGVGLAWSPQMAKYLAIAAPPLNARRYQDRQAAVVGWHRQPVLVASLAQDPSLGSRKTPAAQVVGALLDYHEGRKSYAEAASALGHTVAWLHKRERIIKRQVADLFDLAHRKQLDD
jgi:hypothetical protein